MTAAPRSTRPAVPEGRRIYAIGDVHGRADLLARLLADIISDGKRHRESEKRIVFLGDYVDRGPESKRVIDLVLDAAPPGFAVTALKGNHEELMLRFLDELAVARTWMFNGGDATLASYGVKPTGLFASTEAFEAAQADLNAKLPERHRDFLMRLPLNHVEGDYYFVHAGVRPGVPLAQQKSEDLLWIRDEFLESPADFGKVVVHGHSIVPIPVQRPNRIDVDTGAFATGQLTCVVLDGTTRDFLHT